MELWDVYDIDRRPLGETVPRGRKLRADQYHTVIHVCIFNSEGKMLIQQRQARKSWAYKWDVSCGGCVVAGETPREAAQREVFEELGLKIELEGVRNALTVSFENGFDDFYLINAEPELSALRLQQEEVQAVRWASMEEIFSMIDGGQFIPFFKSFIHLLFDLRKKPDCLNI